MGKLKSYHFKNMTILGIDPAFRQEGTALCLQKDRELLFWRPKDLWELMDWIRVHRHDLDYVMVEDSYQDRVTYPRGKGKKLKVGTIAKISRDVGMNQAASQYIISWAIKCLGEDKVIGVTPGQKGKKQPDNIFQGIVRQDKMTIIGGYKPQKNYQDERDAYMVICAGRELARRKELRKNR